MKVYSIKEFQKKYPAILKKLPVLLSRHGRIIAKIEKYTEYILKEPGKAVDNSPHYE